MHSSTPTSNALLPPLLRGPLLCDGQRTAATALILPAAAAAAHSPTQSQIISIQCLYAPLHTQTRPERPMILAEQQGEGVSWSLSFSHHRPHFTWTIQTQNGQGRAVMALESNDECSDIRRPLHVSLSFDSVSLEASMHIQTDAATARTTFTLPPNSLCPFSADLPLWIGAPADEAVAVKSCSPFRGLIAHVRASIVSSASIEQSVLQLAADAIANNVIASNLAARGWTDSPALMRPCPSTAEPIHSLDQLLAWQSGYDPLHVPRLRDVLPRCLPAFPRARVIHCHDMAFRSDIDGQHGSAEFAAYAFRWWKYIDSFVYFSHARIAVPPVAWIQAAHANGVKVLANFCTEWSEGERENARLLTGAASSQSALTDVSDPKPMWQRYADAMVALSVEYGFDGWFLNIEAPLPTDHDPVRSAADGLVSSSASSLDPSPVPDDAPIKLCGSVLRLCEFIAYLRDAMHLARAGSLVIVYDSLLASSGQVKWQSKLSRENECFLHCSDGLFTDYHWKQDWPAKSATLAASRSLSVFTGIDLFGRGTFGGGGFDAWRALDVIRDAGTSIALFAPAWTFEGEGRRERGWAAFQAAENRLWIGERGMHEIQSNGLGVVASTTSYDNCGWTLTHGGDGWKIVSRSDHDLTRSAFVASHKLCLRHKRIDLLEHFSRERLQTNPEICIQTEFAGTGPNVADAYQLSVRLLAEDGVTVIDTFHLSAVASSSEYKQVTHTFRGYGSASATAASSSSSSSCAHVRFVDWTDGGEDAEKWAGHFGTRIGESRVWVAPALDAAEAGQSRAKCIADYVEPRTQSLCSLLPFVHSFNTGNGRDFFIAGRSVTATPHAADPAPWFNLSLQDNQTVLADCFIADGASQRSEGIVVRAECSHNAAAFEGGSCLRFECTSNGSCSAASVIFDCLEFGLDAHSEQVASSSHVDLSYVWTTTSPAWRIALVLESGDSSEPALFALDLSSTDCSIELLEADWMRVRTRISMALAVATRRIRIRVSCDGSNHSAASMRLGQLRIVAAEDASVRLPAPVVSASSALVLSSSMSAVESTALIAAPSRLQCIPHFLLSSLSSARLMASFSFSWEEPKASGAIILSYDAYFGATWRARVLRCMYFAPTLLRCSSWTGRGSAVADSAASSTTLSLGASASVVKSCDALSPSCPCPCSFRVIANLASGERLQLQWHSA